MKKANHIVNTTLTKCKSIKHIFVFDTKRNKIGRSLTLMALLSIILISNPALGEAESPIIYGFWPESMDPSSYQPDWEVLTHVAYSSWDVNSDGSLTAPENISRYETVRDLAHQHGVKVIISISTGNFSTIDSVLANHREEFAKNVLNVVQLYGADGVNLDFEFPLPTNSITQTSNIVLFEEFMKNLNTTLKTANPDYHVSIDISSVIEDVFCNKNLNQYMDSIFLMGYEYNYWHYGFTGPGSPLNDPTRSDINDSINRMLPYYNPQKIILGVPFYAYNFEAASGNAGAARVNNNAYTILNMADAIAGTQMYGRHWDSNSSSPWYTYKDGNSVWHQVWYEDEESIGLKYDYVKSMNLGGIGFWALGYDYPNIWRLFHASWLKRTLEHISNT